MDAASGVAGLIGLAALATQTTFKLGQLIGCLRKLPNNLAFDLQWLKQLHTPLRIIEIVCLEDSSHVSVSDLELLDSFVHGAAHVVRRLTDRIEKQVASLNDVGGIVKQARKLKIVLRDSESKEDIREIQRIIQGLHLCHSEVARQAA